MLFIELILYWTWYFSWISALISHNSQQNQVDDVGMFSGSCVLSGFITCYLNLLHDWSICEKSVRWLTTITSSSWHDKICWSVWWKENCGAEARSSVLFTVCCQVQITCSQTESSDVTQFWWLSKRHRSLFHYQSSVKTCKINISFL